MPSQLIIDKLSIYHNDTPLVREASFQLASGQITTLMGPSGSGKTLLGLSLAGLLPDHLTLTGSVQHKTKHDTTVGFVFQNASQSLSPTKNMRQHLVDTLIANQCASDDIRLKHILDTVGLTPHEEILKAYPYQLSGGQIQRMSFALTLASNRQVLIADEPTAALDQASKTQLTKQLLSLAHQHQMSILLITHDQRLSDDIADQQLYLKNQEVLHQPPTPSPTTYPELKEHHQTHRHQPIVQINRLSLQHTNSTLPLFKDFSTTIYPKRSIGIMGNNGTGKTSLARALMLLIPFSGQISVQNTSINPLNRKDCLYLRSQIQMVFQEAHNSLNPRMLLRSIMDESISSDVKKTDIYPYIVDRINIHNQLDHYPHQLSGGQAQLICLLQALSRSPKILILDEPTASLDNKTQQHILHLLYKHQQKTHITYLFISHDKEMIDQYCDTLWLLHKGSILEKPLSQ